MGSKLRSLLPFWVSFCYRRGQSDALFGKLQLFFAFFRSIAPSPSVEIPFLTIFTQRSVASALQIYSVGNRKNSKFWKLLAISNRHYLFPELYKAASNNPNCSLKLANKSTSKIPFSSEKF